MPQNNKRKRKFGIGDIIVILIFVAILATIIIYALNNNRSSKELTLEELKQELYKDTDNDGILDNLKTSEETQIESISYTGYSGDGFNGNLIKITGRYKKGSTYTTFTSIIDREDFEKIKEAASIIKIYNPTPVSNFSFLNLVISLLPIIILGGFLFFLVKSNASGNNQAFEFSKSRARLSTKSDVKFNDVAGLDEEKQEMIEIVDFLKNPAKYHQMGARIPKGILLCGDPGTGKTLLAKAVAGEANVPFYSISGSDFVEVFVGVGASRVRDMFKTAKQSAPCIIFIDEIDAVGRQRGTGIGGGHDEREQTLNQILVEMDGFQPNSGVIVMAATNRADVLDPALLRAGRFDRQITVSNPDVKARLEILKVHARNKKLSPRVNLEDIAKRTPGFSGADLENLLNEAALLAARENAKEIKIYHLDEAVDRVMMGPAKKSKKYSDEEKKRIAFHEAGHAVIGIKLKYADKVQKITIIPRGHAGGYNLMMPEEETFTKTKTQLLAEITSFLGGRIAEELTFNEISTGAYDDIKRATAIARAMVTELGMSSLGPVQYEQAGGQTFLGRDYLTEKRFSDQVALEIDQEVRKLINESYEQGKKIITENKDLLALIANHLIEVETLTREDIDELVSTGKLAWLEKKKAKDAQKKAEEEAKKQAEETEASNEEPSNENVSDEAKVSKNIDASQKSEASNEDVSDENKVTNETKVSDEAKASNETEVEEKEETNQESN